MRILIQTILIIQQNLKVVGTGSSTEFLIEDILSYVVLTYFLGIYIAIAWELLYEIIDLFKPDMKYEDDDKKTKNKNQKQSGKEKK